MTDKDSIEAKPKIDLSGNKSTTKKPEFKIDDILTKLLTSRK